jgi:3-oxosteroid 1-dehydrogenase
MSAERFDLIVVGSGAAGMTAALAAACAGLQPLLLEKAARVGGTTARSGGAVWIPDSAQHAAAGRAPDRDKARRYLDALVGTAADPALRSAYLDAGPAMLAWLERESSVRFDDSPAEPDYHSEIPGAADGGRVLRPRPFDGRRLGADFGLLASPIPELTVLGGMMVTRPEAARLLRLPWSADAWRLAARLALRHAGDRLGHTRGTRLVLGNALAASLLHSLRDRRVPIRLDTTFAGLLTGAGGRVDGVSVHGPDGERTLAARLGVILAGGGFPANPALRERYLPEPTPSYTPAAEGCTGDTLISAQQAGAVLAGDADNALWFPVSVRARGDGSTAVWPHIIDRAKPGLIAVDAHGRRFANEAQSYHAFGRAAYDAYRRGQPCIPATLICDRTFLWRYGLGLVRPHARRLDALLESGYLLRGDTPRQLAGAAGIDPDGLEATISRHNAFARTGTDQDFGKGSRVYDRSNGDPEHRPNPCVGPIATGPFYAVRVRPAPLATSLGIRADARGRALDASGQPIPGLWACGNDMASPFGGSYAGAGAQIGPAMVFGYLAGRDAAAARHGGG